jgi:hypothetical protein
VAEECGAAVGGSFVTFPCDLPLPRGHDGPCRSIDNAPSVARRKRWEAEQKALAEQNPARRVPDDDQVVTEPPGAEYIVPPSLRLRPGDQSLPVPNGEESIQDSVIRDIQARRDLGIRRYGTPLQPFNGRDALRDAYDEALDLACYLKQAIVERDRASGPK